MSIILKKVLNGVESPLLYIDTINESSYMNEAITLTIRYIRENSDLTETKRSDHIVKVKEDIDSKND